MFEWIINKITGDYNTKQLKKIYPIVDQINDYVTKWKDLSDDQIKAKTLEFKKRYKNGESLDDILPEAFAVVKLACQRMIGTELNVKDKKLVRDMVPYDVQLVGGIVLHQGKIAEMRTGEGKTLVATLPAYLNALSEKPVHVVTVNDYLASRDAEWMGYLYNWLGLTVGSITKFTPLDQHRDEYTKDIIYVENTELGFDYLRDNLEKSKDNRRLMNRGLYYAIVDEADSIFIDEARTPMVMSQANNDPVDKYIKYAQLIKNLKAAVGKKKISKGFLHDILHENQKEQNLDDGDYYIDEKTKSVTLSEIGISRLEQILGVDNIYKDLGYDEIHHIENALLAHGAYISGKDYIIQKGEVLIVDENTGRVMPGRRFQGGLHQAIEAKEGLQIKQEAKTIASITYQNFFKLYEKISGMSGTAVTEAEEFEKIYELEVITIPTHQNILRVDLDDKVFFNQNAKRKAVLDNIKFYHKLGQPILIGTSSVHTSELVSKMLTENTITHYVLNAKYHEQEAEIIGNAGKSGSVVVATNMAGRGTDIKLDKDLNDKIADKYMQYILTELQQGKKVNIDTYSQYEHDLLMDKLSKIEKI